MDGKTFIGEFKEDKMVEGLFSEFEEDGTVTVYQYTDDDNGVQYQEISDENKLLKIEEQGEN
jgi:hypothetical protein